MGSNLGLGRWGNGNLGFSARLREANRKMALGRIGIVGARAWVRKIPRLELGF